MLCIMWKLLKNSEKLSTVYHIPFVAPRSEPLNLSSPLEVGEEVLVRYPSRTIDPGLSAISEMKKKKN